MAKIYLGKDETVQLIKSILGTINDGTSDVINNTLMAKAKYLLNILETGMDNKAFGSPTQIVSSYSAGTKVTGKGYVFLCAEDYVVDYIKIDGEYPPLEVLDKYGYGCLIEKIPFNKSVEITRALDNDEPQPAVIVCY